VNSLPTCLDDPSFLEDQENAFAQLEEMIVSSKLMMIFFYLS
jgi:hypothetical protein